MNYLYELPYTSWQLQPTDEQQDGAIQALEQGQVLYCPQLPFILTPEERAYLTPDFVDPKHKNISYDVKTGELKGTKTPASEHPDLTAMMQRYAEQSKRLVEALFPQYQTQLKQARTSYRPVQVKGRPSSYRKDDTRLHVDAFPSSPIGDRRILRVFANVNPNDEARVWRLGAPFNEVAAKFLPSVRHPLPFEAEFLQLIKATKSKRTEYDHYMNQLHNKMKADMDYQRDVKQIECRFPTGSTWMVFTDQASHAAMDGQYLLEQSFYLPVEAMRSPELAPLKVLEQALSRALV